MNVNHNILSFSVTLVYAASTILYGVDFYWKSHWASISKKPVIYLTAIIHLLYLTSLLVLNGYPPIVSVFQLMSMIAFTLLVTYLFIELTTRVVDTGFFVITVALIFQFVSFVFIRETEQVSESLKNPMVSLHIITALLGYSAMSIAGIYSLLYLILHRQIQTNHYGILFERLPNLELFEKMSFYAVLFGFFFLTIAFIAGVLWIPQSSETFSIANVKMIATIIVWVIYGCVLLFRKPLSLQGKRMAFVLISGLCFAFLSMTVLNLFSSRFHS